MTNGTKATRGAKMLYLIKRKPPTSREELVAHWFANHMPAVVKAQHDRAAHGKAHAWRYTNSIGHRGHVLVEKASGSQFG